VWHAVDVDPVDLMAQTTGHLSPVDGPTGPRRHAAQQLGNRNSRHACAPPTVETRPKAPGPNPFTAGPDVISVMVAKVWAVSIAVVNTRADGYEVFL
jgi:hypothetical protein